MDSRHAVVLESFFFRLPTSEPIESVEVTSETLLVDSPLFKCLTWVSIGCFPRYSYVFLCVFFLDASAKTSRTIKELFKSIHSIFESLLA